MRSPKSPKSSKKPLKPLSPSKGATFLPMNSSNRSSHKKHLYLDSNQEGIKNNNENPTNKRAASISSFYSSSTRRRSFLSSSMINNENYLVYEISSFEYDYNSNRCPKHGGSFSSSSMNENCICPLIPRYSVSLNESQGFNWNQDLFANQYQQQQGVLCYNDPFEDEDENNGKHDIVIPRTRVFSYSSSHDEGNMDKVEVIEVKVDEEDMIVGF